jgi:hypothetical protein
MSKSPTSKEVVSAIVDALQARLDYNADQFKAQQSGVYSWDYSGHAYDKLEKALDTAADMLEQFVKVNSCPPSDLMP